MAITSLPKSETDIRTLILNKLGDSSTITAAEHREVENALADAIFYTPLGDIKEVACSGTYISENFETSGINVGRGKVGSERYGWAICNGSNLTIDKRGRVGIGYDPISYVITTAGSNTGGVSTVTLDINQIPTHNHVFPGDDRLANANGLGGWTNRTTSNFNYDATSPGGGSGKIYRTSDAGFGQSHNNMQPYIVTLFIQKIDTPY